VISVPEDIIAGKAWRFGSDIDTDVILPSQYMRKPPEEYVRHAMEPLDSDFADAVSEGDILVADRNFGIGSSRQQAVVALDQVGVGAIVATSFSRVFYRNAVNEGLPIVRADQSVVDSIEEGNELELGPFDGVLRDLTTGETHEIEELTEPVRSILASGGATAYYKVTDNEGDARE